MRLDVFVGTYVCMPSSMVALRVSHISPTVAVWNACSSKCCLSPCVDLGCLVDGETLLVL